MYIFLFLLSDKRTSETSQTQPTNKLKPFTKLVVLIAETQTVIELFSNKLCILKCSGLD